MPNRITMYYKSQKPSLLQQSPKDLILNSQPFSSFDQTQMSGISPVPTTFLKQTPLQHDLKRLDWHQRGKGSISGGSKVENHSEQRSRSAGNPTDQAGRLLPPAWSPASPLGLLQVAQILVGHVLAPPLVHLFRRHPLVVQHSCKERRGHSRRVRGGDPRGRSAGPGLPHPPAGQPSDL